MFMDIKKAFINGEELNLNQPLSEEKNNYWVVCDRISQVVDELVFDEDLYIADKLPSFNTMTERLSEIKSDGTQIYGTEKPQNANERRFKINNEDDVANFLFSQFRYYHHTKDKKAVFSGDNFKIHLVFS